MKKKEYIIITSLILMVVLVAGMMMLPKDKNNGDVLTEEEISAMRAKYVVCDENPPMGDSSVPADWGANFATVFDFCDAIITGTLTSDVTSSEETMSMVDLGDWEGTIEELQELNPELINMEYTRFYWTFQVDEVLWQGKESNISKGDVLLFSASDFEYHFDEVMEKGQEYVWAVRKNRATGDYGIFRNASYYKTDGEYLFSFVSGENVNRFTGRKQVYYEQELSKALRDSEVAGIPWNGWDFSE